MALISVLRMSDECYCGLDTVGKCLACGKRRCNTHLVVRAEFNLADALQTADSSFVVRLFHPNGATSFIPLWDIPLQANLRAGNPSRELKNMGETRDSAEVKAFLAGGIRCIECRFNDAAAATS